MVIYKYRLRQKGGEQILSMPEKLSIVHVGLDPEGDYCIWAMIDKDSPVVNKRVRIVATGEPYDDSWVYVSTWLDDLFVWHLLIDKDFYNGYRLPQ